MVIFPFLSRLCSAYLYKAGERVKIGENSEKVSSDNHDNSEGKRNLESSICFRSKTEVSNWGTNPLLPGTLGAPENETS